MPSLAMRFDGRPTSSSPPKVIEPRRWPRMPMIALSVVVLPAPLRPSSVTTSPSPTAKSMPCRMCDSPYQPCRSRTRSSSLPTTPASRTAASAMAGPHIGLDDFRVLRDLGVAALRQGLAAGQDGDGVREIRDDRKVVLDHQHGTVRRDLADERRDPRDVLVAEPGHRL